MMDELRDYRFYKEDMIHPNNSAINYIWEKFSENWLSNEALQIMQQIKKIQRNLEHKPFNSESLSYKEFIKSTEQKIKQLQEKFTTYFFLIIKIFKVVL